MPTRVLIAQGRLMAEAITVALGAAGCEASIAVSEAPEDIRRGALAWRPDVTILDIELRRGVPDGLCLIAALKAMGSAVIVFAAEDAVTLHAACLHAGADGLVTKVDGLSALSGAVERAASGDLLVSDRARSEIFCEAMARTRRCNEARRPFGLLSTRERDVLIALMHGRSAAEIAQETFVSLATVRTHIHTLLAKLEVSSQVAAVAAAHNAGWPDARGRKPRHDGGAFGRGLAQWDAGGIPSGARHARPVAVGA
jgi:two-component system nitrate/nitrite response regulator NarL